MNVENDHEGVRTALALACAAVVGLGAVVATFWVFNGTFSTASAGGLQSIATPLSTTATIDDLPQATSTTTFVPPSPTTGFVPSVSLSIAPAELPTVTLPVPGQTADPHPQAAPVSIPRGSPSSRPPAPSVSDISLSCHKNGDRVMAGLTFRTTAVVSVWLSGGGNVSRQTTAGPGLVSITASGKRAPTCMAVVGTQQIGPMPAS